MQPGNNRAKATFKMTRKQQMPNHQLGFTRHPLQVSRHNPHVIRNPRNPTCTIVVSKLEICNINLGYAPRRQPLKKNPALTVDHEPDRTHSPRRYKMRTAGHIQTNKTNGKEPVRPLRHIRPDVGIPVRPDPPYKALAHPLTGSHRSDVHKGHSPAIGREPKRFSWKLGCQAT